MKLVLPDLVIAGAPKCGTSSVHEWLAAHPQTLGSVPKETGYFADPGSHIHRPGCHVSNGIEGYARFFRLPDGPPPAVTFEATPAYLYHRTALGLAGLESHPRFLFVLREPSAQIFSLYTYCRDNWDWVPQEMDFARFCAAARTGTEPFGGNELCRHAIANADYAQALRVWRERVGADRMKIMLFEDLASDSKAFMQALSRWLGIDPAFYETYDFPRSNETYAVRSRALHSVNLGLRSRLARLGPLYPALRRLYRLANTRRRADPTQAERLVLDQLRLEFAPTNARLAEEFGLDLTAWQGAGP